MSEEEVEIIMKVPRKIFEYCIAHGFDPELEFLDAMRAWLESCAPSNATSLHYQEILSTLIGLRRDEGSNRGLDSGKH
ncbi:MAG: hypothetical protein QXG32_00720 [Candidatus Bathyarchaeia archaeon]